MTEGTDGQTQLINASERTASIPPAFIDQTSKRRSSVLGPSKEVIELQRELARLRRREAEARAAAQRLDEEIRVFERVQRDLFPPFLSKIPGLSIQRLHRPAGQVGGDLFDAVPLGSGRTGITLLDATGHGLTSALIATVAGRAIRSSLDYESSESAQDPAAILARLNRELLASPIEDCYFVSAIFAIYDQRVRTLRWARGGAPYPILIPRDGGARQVVSQGPLLGVHEGAAFEVAELVIRPGDRLMFYTDGLETFAVESGPADACSNLPSTDWFGRLAARSNAQVLAELRHRMESMQGASIVPDDVSVVALKGHSCSC